MLFCGQQPSHMKIRLVWSKSNHHYKHLVKRFFVRMRGENPDKIRGGVGEKVIAINMQRVSAYLGMAAAIFYLALVTVTFLFLRERQPYHPR